MSLFKNSLYSFLDKVGGKLITLASLPILSRILTPDDFGIFAIVISVQTLFIPFLDFGLSPSYVRLKVATKEASNVFFTINAILGFLNFILLVLIAPVLEIIFDRENLLGISVVIGLSVFISSLSAQPLARLFRSKNFKYMMLIRNSGALLSAAGAVFFAVFNAGVWALVAKQFIYNLVICFLFFVVIKHKYKLVNWNKILLYRDSLTFSFEIVINRFVGTLPQSFQKLVFGNLFGTNSLGQFSKSEELLKTVDLIRGSISNPTYSHLARLSTEDRRKRYLFYFNSIFFLTGPICLILSVVGDIFILWFLGDQWGEAGTYIRWLGLYMLGKILSQMLSVVYYLEDETRTLIKLTFFDLIFVIISSLVGLFTHDALLFIASLSVMTLVYWLTISYIVLVTYTEQINLASNYLRTVFISILAYLPLGYIIRNNLNEHKIIFEKHNDIVQFLIIIIICTIVNIIANYYFNSSFTQNFIKNIKRN